MPDDITDAPSAYAGDEEFRLAALAAFAHELRTPLTAIHMVVELGRDRAAGGLVFDAELSAMILQSLDDIEALADGIQDVSRLDRGLLRLAAGPTSLVDAVAEAGAMVPSSISLEAGPFEDVEGPWDAPRLSVAIAGIVEGVHRGGDGGGRVGLAVVSGEDSVDLVITSGVAAGEARTLDAGVGFRFYAARRILTAMGAAVTCERTAGHMAATVRLPR